MAAITPGSDTLITTSGLNAKNECPMIRDVKKLPRDAGFYVMGVVTKFCRRKDRNDNPFWNVTIADTSGDIEGKIWSNSIWKKWDNGAWDTFSPILNDVPKFENASIGLRGKVGEYREQLQYNFTEVYYLDQKKYPPHDFVRRSPIPNDRMQTELNALIAETHEPIKSFLTHIFSSLDERYNSLPAAVIHHHAYVGGLMEHSLCVAGNARAIARHYIDFSAEDINLDIVIAGALLHDLGKIDAYTLVPAPKMTLPGNVVDHIALGYHRLIELAKQENLPEDITLALAHIIISHHGRREYGSPLLPATREAMIVAMADNLDFQIAAWHKQISELEADAEITEYIPVLERRLWRGVPSNSTQQDADER